MNFTIGTDDETDDETVVTYPMSTKRDREDIECDSEPNAKVARIHDDEEDYGDEYHTCKICTNDFNDDNPAIEFKCACRHHMCVDCFGKHDRVTKVSTEEINRLARLPINVRINYATVVRDTKCPFCMQVVDIKRSVYCTKNGKNIHFNSSYMSNPLHLIRNSPNYRKELEKTNEFEKIQTAVNNEREAIAFEIKALENEIRRLREKARKAEEEAQRLLTKAIAQEAELRKIQLEDVEDDEFDFNSDTEEPPVTRASINNIDFSCIKLQVCRYRSHTGFIVSPLHEDYNRVVYFYHDDNNETAMDRLLSEIGSVLAKHKRNGRLPRIVKGQRIPEQYYNEIIHF